MVSMLHGKDRVGAITQFKCHFATLYRRRCGGKAKQQQKWYNTFTIQPSPSHHTIWSGRRFALVASSYCPTFRCPFPLSPNTPTHSDTQTHTTSRSRFPYAIVPFPLCMYVVARLLLLLCSFKLERESARTHICFVMLIRPTREGGEGCTVMLFYLPPDLPLQIRTPRPPANLTHVVQFVIAIMCGIWWCVAVFGMFCICVVFTFCLF